MTISAIAKPIGTGAAIGYVAGVGPMVIAASGGSGEQAHAGNLVGAGVSAGLGVIVAAASAVRGSREGMLVGAGMIGLGATVAGVAQLTY